MTREKLAAGPDQIRRADLKRLAHVRSDAAPIFSLYLDLRPERKGAEPPLTRFKNMLRQAEEKIGLKEQPRTYRTKWAEEVEQLHTWFEREQPLRGRGLVLLSGRASALWRVLQLPVPVRDRLEVGDRPFLRPLATLLDEFERYLLVLIDAGTGRLIEVQLGSAEVVAEVKNEVPHAAGNIVEKPGHQHDTYLHRHALSVAERSATVWRERGSDWLVIGGTEEALGELRNLLTKELRARLAGELHLSPQVELAQLLDAVEEIEREHETQVEAQRVETLVTSALKKGPGVLGLEATLLALVEESVLLLMVEEEFAQPGWECSNCTFLGATQQQSCPLCGSALRWEADIVESALTRVLDLNGDIEVLRSPQSRQALAPYGRIGALLRYAVAAPVADEPADQ